MSTAEYKKMTYDRIGLVVRKGKRDEYQQAANNFGLSLSELIKIATEKFITEGDGNIFVVKPTPTEPNPESEKLTSEQKRLIEEFNQLPVDAQKYFLKAFKAINESKGGGEND